MLRNNHIKYGLVALYLLAILIAPFVISVPKADAYTSRTDCATKLRKIDDVSKLRKAINSASDNRIKKIGELRKDVNALPEEQKNTMNAGLDADKTFLEGLKTDSAAQTDVAKLQSNYCDAIYKTQIYQFRARQIHYLKYINASLKRDTTFLSILENPYNTNVVSLLKEPVDERYNSARKLINDNISAENAAMSQVLSANITDSTNNLVKPTFNGAEPKLSYSAALKSYNEAAVLRKAASSFNRDRTLTLVSVNVFYVGPNKDGDKRDKIITDGSPSKANEAEVVVQVNGEKDKSTRKLTRADRTSPWRITK